MEMYQIYMLFWTQTFTQDIQDFAHIILRYTSKISSDEASGGDLKLYINGCCKEKTSKREKALRFRSFTEECYGWFYQFYFEIILVSKIH